MLVGIFDSGMGGLSVLAEAMHKFPSIDFIYYGDSKHAPYGTKSKKEVLTRSYEICDYLIKAGAEAIIVACNTATSAAIVELRDKYSIPIIGMEPALKPALGNYKGGAIVVMATPMTLAEEKFQKLMATHSSHETIYKIPTPQLVNLVESGVVEGDLVDQTLEDYFTSLDLNTVESVVLGCTHFLFLRPAIQAYFGDRVSLVDGHQGTLMQLERKILVPPPGTGSKQYVLIVNTKGQSFVDQSWSLLEKYEVVDGN